MYFATGIGNWFWSGWLAHSESGHAHQCFDSEPNGAYSFRG